MSPVLYSIETLVFTLVKGLCCCHSSVVRDLCSNLLRVTSVAASSDMAYECCFFSFKLNPLSLHYLSPGTVSTTESESPNLFTCMRLSSQFKKQSLSFPTAFETLWIMRLRNAVLISSTKRRGCCEDDRAWQLETP